MNTIMFFTVFFIYPVILTCLIWRIKFLEDMIVSLIMKR